MPWFCRLSAKNLFVTSSRDFLDTIHQRLYQLYSQCWSKYRLFIRAAEEKDPRDRERLFCLIGLAAKELRECLPDAWSLVRYGGLFTQSPRSAEGLQTLLRDALGVRSLKIEQCVLRKAPIPPDQQARIGISGVNIGLDVVLGTKMSDRMGKFRIHIGPLSKEDFDHLLPGTPPYEKLARLMRLYIAVPLDLDVRITMAAGDARPLSLGDPNRPRLGLNAWSFSGDTLGEVSATFPLANAAAPTAAPASADDLPDDRTGWADESPPSSLIDYYQDELARLRDFAMNYAESHPELSSMIGGPLADPGVERLLEGVAFLNANLQQKLNDDFPEVIHELAEAIEPRQMRPIPATTIVAFTAKPELVRPLLIPAGTEVASLPVDGTTCRFRTCFDITLLPLTLLDATFSDALGKPPRIVLSYRLNRMPLSGWKTPCLRFFLGDSYSKACDLYLLLLRYLQKITLTEQESNRTIEIPVDCLKPSGFGADEMILATESTSCGHLMLQEYFLFPDKYLFLDLHGLQRCSELGGGSSFRIEFELKMCRLPVAVSVTMKSFILSAVPVVNLFHHKAQPLTFVNDTTRQQVKPDGKPPEHYQVYSVDKITTVEMGTVEEKTYSRQKPLFKTHDDSELCRITQTASASAATFETWLSLESDIEEKRRAKKVNVDLTCTNGSLPERLGPGTVSCPTGTTPESASFTNIKPITAAIPFATQRNNPWKILAEFSLNTLSLQSAHNFRALLRQYLPIHCRNQADLEAHHRKVNGVKGINVVHADRLMNGMMLRGYDVRLTMCSENYSGPGDLFLFCSVVERFLGGYGNENCFVRLIVEESQSGYAFDFPARVAGIGVSF